MGDLVLTCTGDMSRNRQVGLQLASGAGLDAILASTATVAEGVRTAALAMQLAERHGVDMPITAEMQAIMKRERAPGEAISRLMNRALRDELSNERNST
jgi:glycerol-3-phosphate dehydrogenase (NAD(P)+)